MRLWWVLGVFALASCAKAPAPASPSAPVPSAALVANASPWPDVTAPLRFEGGHGGDVAVVVAIEHYPKLPPVPGALEAGAEWVRFLTQVLGVPASNVTAIDDGDATRSAILAALQRATYRPRAGGRLWFIFIGQGGANLAPVDAGDARDKAKLLPASKLIEVAGSGPGQLIQVFDTAFDARLDPLLGPHSRYHPHMPLLTRHSVVIDEGLGGYLPGTSRPGFSYLFQGALRGWADANGDGGVTVREAVDYAHATLRTLLRGHVGSGREYRAPFEWRASFECRSLATLSTFDEKPPDLPAVVPRNAPSPALVDLQKAAYAVRVADAYLAKAYERFRETNGAEGVAERKELEFEGDSRASMLSRPVKVVPLPHEIVESIGARIRYANLLGGAASRDGAKLLVEAARYYFVYGHLDDVRALLEPVLDARCAIDEPGYDAWEILVSTANFRHDLRGARTLGELECYFDAASEERFEQSRHGTWDTWDRPKVMRSYDAGVSTLDPEVAACNLEDAATRYDRILRADPTPQDRPEATLNGGDAYRRLDRPDDAAALYQIYLRAQSHGIEGDSTKVAAERHKYTVRTCRAFFELARDAPRLLPAYFDSCQSQDWLSCEEGDVADCGALCPSGGKRCARWADHAEAGVGVVRDRDGARRVWKTMCDGGAQDACRRLELPPPETPAVELERRMAAARNLVLRASALDELSNWESGEARLAMLHGAEAWFRAAADAWRGVFDRAAEEPFRSESLLRIAEARYSIVASVVALGERLSPAEVASARTAALAMGSLAVGTRRKLAARLFIDLADRVLESKEHEFSESHRERGVEPRKEVRFEGVDDARKVVRSAVPPEVMDTVRARDDYVATVLPTDDVERTRARYAFEAARTFLFYGDLEQARARLERLYASECHRTATGFDSWLLLTHVLMFEHDTPASLKLVNEADCALDPYMKILGKYAREPMLMSSFFVDCAKAHEGATHLPEGPERRKVLDEAAACFAYYLDIAPNRDESAEAALRGANDYQELGDSARAIELYGKYIDRYASEDLLGKLEAGVPDSKPPFPPQRWRYEERVTGLAEAYDVLAGLYQSTRDYARAARLLATEAIRKRLPKDKRLAAARRAVELAGARGAPGLLRELQKTLAELGAPAAEKRRVSDLIKRATAALDTTFTVDP